MGSPTMPSQFCCWRPSPANGISPPTSGYRAPTGIASSAQGRFFCGMVRGMRRGDYLEVEGELRALEQDRGVVVAGERFSVKRSTYAVHAVRIQRLDRPDALVDYGDSDDDNREVQP